MRQAKKVFTRMCLNNWGGISHQILKFHEYVNLFSGKSGSGKSTVMDAIQVILYGSFSSAFLNKAADDTKNRRSVLSYLRGAQKDGTSNRGNADFCAHIVLEIEDKGSHITNCVGIAFEVGRQDQDIRKFIYFSHSGKIPENGYLREDGVPFSNREISALIAERAKSGDNRGRGEVNRTYPSKEAYLNTLYDVIFGYIDGSRFVTMEKSAIALRMTSGTGQFIRDYMFPKSAQNPIEKISDQLGAYRDIRERIDDLEKRIGLLAGIGEQNRELARTRADIVRVGEILKYVEIEGLRSRIEASESSLDDLQRELSRLEQDRAGLRESFQRKNQEWIDVEADLKSSDYGEKKEHLKRLQTVIDLLGSNSGQWRKVAASLSQWEDDEVVTDYVSNPALRLIGEIRRGKVTAENCDTLRMRLNEAKESIEEELSELNQERRELKRELEEKKGVIADMKSGQKHYDDRLKQARAQLERRLSDRFGKNVRVYIFADLFNITDDEWRDAVEGRMGRLKFSLLTDPQYAHEAAVQFRQMRKQCRGVDLIHSAAIVKDGPQAEEGSLYEAVSAELEFVDACLRRYLGHIKKCRSVDELEAVRDGVTPDCYSYSGYMFRHLREKDYTVNACIGCKVSKARLADLEAEAKKMEDRLRELNAAVDRLKASRSFEAFSMETERLLELSEAAGELEEKLGEKERLEQVLRELESGEIAGLKKREKELEAELGEINRKTEALSHQLSLLAEQKGSLSKELDEKKEDLGRRLEGYIPGGRIAEEVRSSLRERSEASLRTQKNQEKEELMAREQQGLEALAKARQRFNLEYPSYGFSGMEKENDVYDRLLARFQSDYVPEYQQEFRDQCDRIYRSLRTNVLVTIHGEIKAAYRHAHEINRLLKETSFSDSIYQIEIQAADNENGQFYDMLTARELDSRVSGEDGIEGQLSLEEDSFLQKYGEKLRLLTEKFIPPKEDDRQIPGRKQEMERYADYRNYLSFSMYERVLDENGNERKNFVDDMAGRDSGGEGQNPKYVALLAGFAMLYLQQSNRESRIKLVLLDEAFSKMDQERSEVCLRYARKLNLQLIVCVPDERLQSLIRNVDCVYGFRRFQNQITVMHIDKGRYLEMLEGLDEEEEEAVRSADS